MHLLTVNAVNGIGQHRADAGNLGGRERRSQDDLREALAADLFHDEIGAFRQVAGSHNPRDVRAAQQRQDRLLDFEAHHAQRGLARADAWHLHHQRKGARALRRRRHPVDVSVATGVQATFDLETVNVFARMNLREHRRAWEAEGDSATGGD